MKKDPELPHDVVISILAGLPVRSLFKFKAVCSLWRKTIETPHFVRLHASCCHEPEEKVLMQDSAAGFYVADVNTLSVRKIVPGFELTTKRGLLNVYSSNGVLLLVEHRRKPRMVLWNPATGKHKHIQPPPDARRHSRFYGFWYDDSCNQFRILNIRSNNQVFVFDSDFDSWKTVDALPRNLCVQIFELENKAFIHGGFHVPALDKDEKRHRILSLSPEGKVIRDFWPPSDWNKLSHDSFIFHLTAKAWDGRLCLQSLAWHSCSEGYEYWNMAEYGNSKPWTKVLRIVKWGYTLVSLQQNGRHLWRNMNEICVKDGDSVEMKTINISSYSKSMSYVGTYSYTPTLLSP